MMMKKIILALLALAALHMSGATKIVVMSDIHAMAPALVEKPGEAFDRYAAADMRMIKESANMLRTAVSEAIAERPDLVMISGDLTKDGERLSHEFVVEQLGRLRAHGIKALVIPGNHDISNANAQCFNGSERRPAATITRSDFRKLYALYGYGSTTQHDTASLSYAAEPVKGLVVIGIDSNRDEENLLKARGDSVNTYHTAGRVKESTLRWVTDRAREARAQGKRVVAMMHHHLIEHFDGEARLLNKYVVADHEHMRNALVAAGVHVIFTGHLHLSDIARDYCGTDSITEVATGSLVTYPFHYRTITIDADSMSVATHQIKSVPTNARLLAEGKQHVEQAVPALMNGMVSRLTTKLSAVAGKLGGFMAMLGGESSGLDLSKIGSRMADAIRTHFTPLATEAFIMIYEGNEGQNPKSAALLARMENAMETVLDEAFASTNGEMVKDFVVENAVPRAAAVLRSALEDRNHIDTPQQVTVDDHTTTFHF